MLFQNWFHGKDWKKISCSFEICYYFGVKMLPAQNITWCYLQKKMCNYLGFNQGLNSNYTRFMYYIAKL